MSVMLVSANTARHDNLCLIALNAYDFIFSFSETARVVCREGRVLLSAASGAIGASDMTFAHALSRICMREDPPLMDPMPCFPRAEMGAFSLFRAYSLIRIKSLIIMSGACGNHESK